MAKSRHTHTKKVRELLAGVSRDEKAILKLGMAVMSAGAKGEDDREKEVPFFPLDLLALGAIKRNVATANAMRQMVRAWNMVCARTLLRTHIDTALRFSAAWLVDEPHRFASNVLGGARIDGMKDAKGRLLKDMRLVEVHSVQRPWLRDVYSNLSGYVHFSGSHVYDSVRTLDDELRTISSVVSARDEKYPEFSWVEILECFREATEMLAELLHGYRATKGLSRAQFDALRSAALEAAATPRR
jgi:hypothetical protein